jgi:integrase/recombinase XerD
MAAAETYTAQFTLWMRARAFSERSVETYQANIRRFFQYLTERGVDGLKEVTPGLVSQYQVYLSIQPGLKGKKLALSTQHHLITSLKTFFRAMVHEGKLLFDPSGHIEFPKVRRNLPREILTFEEMDALLNAPNPEIPIELRDKAILELFYSSALRNTELRSLAVKDVDFISRMVRIRHAKGDKERVVPTGRIAASYLEEYLREVRPRLAKNKTTETLFLTRRGRMLDETIPAYIVQKYAKRVNIAKPVDAHTIRHTCATHLLQCGADLRYIQELLGHTSLNTTQIYTQVMPIDLRKVHAQTHPRERGFPSAEVA